MNFVLKAKGYHENRLAVTPETDASAAVQLAVVEPRPRPNSTHRLTAKAGSAKHAHEKIPDLKSGDVVDPFAR